MIQVEIDDKQILNFTKKSPARAKWATAEALKMCGGHYRKKIRAYIESGGENWKPLSEASKRIKRTAGKLNMTPLYGLAQFVRFIYGVRQGRQRMSLGFIGRIARIARLAQYGGKRRVSESRRKFLNFHGMHMKESTKFIDVPARPIIEPFDKKHNNGMKKYVEIKFFKKFLSKEKTRLTL